MTNYCGSFADLNPCKNTRIRIPDLRIRISNTGSEDGSEDGSADSLKHREYQLSKFTCKTFLFMATNDGLADPSLASEYKSVLPSLQKVRRVDLTHIGFLWGVNANSEVYQPIIKICTDSSSQKKLSGQDEEQN